MDAPRYELAVTVKNDSLRTGKEVVRCMWRRKSGRTTARHMNCVRLKRWRGCRGRKDGKSFF